MTAESETSVKSSFHVPADQLPPGFSTRESTTSDSQSDDSEPSRRVHFLSELVEPLTQLGFFAGDPRIEPDQFIEGRGQHAVYSIPSLGRVLWKHCTRGGLMEPLLGDLHRNPDRFLTELRLTEEARTGGISVARILAVRIDSARGGWCRVDVLSEFVDESRDGASFLSDGSIMPDEQREILRTAARELRRFHGLGFLHGDLNVKNLLWHTHQERPHVTLIDLDPGSVSRAGGGATPVANILRLARSYLKGVRDGEWNLSRTALHAFLSEYFRGDRASLRDFWRSARRRARLQEVRRAITLSGVRGSRSAKKKDHGLTRESDS